MKRICLTIGLTLTPLSAYANCAQGPFETFFRGFAADIAVQEAVTPDRILLSQLDHEAQPEPVAVEKEVARDDLEWPLVPNLTQFERAGGSVFYEASEGGQSVTLSGDSGYLMVLIFTQEPCWRLAAIKDESM